MQISFKDEKSAACHFEVNRKPCSCLTKIKLLLALCIAKQPSFRSLNTAMGNKDSALQFYHGPLRGFLEHFGGVGGGVMFTNFMGDVNTTNAIVCQRHRNMLLGCRVNIEHSQCSHVTSEYNCAPLMFPARDCRMICGSKLLSLLFFLSFFLRHFPVPYLRYDPVVLNDFKEHLATNRYQRHEQRERA